MTRSLVVLWLVLCSVLWSQPGAPSKGLNPAYVKSLEVEIDGLLKAGDFEEGSRVLDSLREYLIREFAFTKAIEAARTTLSLTDRIKNKKRVADAYNGIGNALWRLGLLDSALHYLNAGLEFRKGVDDARGLAVNYNLMGLVYWRKGDTEKSYRSYLRALAIREGLGDANEISLLNSNIGLIFQRMKYYDLAEQHIRKALAIADSVGFENGRMYSMRRLLGLNIIRGNYAEAIKYIDTVVKYYERVKNKGSLAQLYNDIGIINEKQGKPEEALKWFVKSREMARQLADRFIEAFALLNLGRVQLVSGEVKGSEESLKRGMEFAQKGGYHVILRDIYLELSKLYLKKGDDKQANLFLNQHVELKDSILSESVLTSIGEMRIRYEIERSKEKQEYLENILEERNRTTLVLLALVVFFLAGAGMITFLFLRQKRLGKLLSEKNLELGEVNDRLQKGNEELTVANDTKTKLFSIIGHDLKSPFVSILGFSELLHEEAERLRDGSVKELSGKILDSSMKLVDLVNNLTSWALEQREMIRAQKVFFGVEEVVSLALRGAMLNMELKGISWKVDFEKPDVVFADREMISTVMRNLLMNAIKFSYTGGHIDLRGRYVGGMYRITITDTGVGMSEDMIRNILHGSGMISTYGTANEKGTGLGLSVSRDFITRNGGKLEIESEPGDGSSFIVEIPTS